VNVYDFDKTVYKDDSTVDFYFFSLKRNPKVLLCLPSLICAAILWGLGIIKKTQFKERFYKFLTKIKDIDTELEIFWDKNEGKIKDFYKKNKRDDDVIISASPEFLLNPICKRLGIKHLYASRVDKKSGKYDGENCWGAEKVRRFYEAFGEGMKIEEFYSDSLSDTPLAELSKKSYIVIGEELVCWQDFKPKEKKIKMFFSKEFLLFLVVGVVNTFNGTLFSWFYSLAVENANAAFVLGYLTSLSIAYFLNSFVIFKAKPNLWKYIKFCISYIPNFIIQNLVVIAVYNILNQDKLVAYILAAIIGIPVTFLVVKLFAFAKKDTDI